MKAKLTFCRDINGMYPVVLFPMLGCVLVLARVGQFKPIRIFPFTGGKA